MSTPEPRDPLPCAACGRSPSSPCPACRLPRCAEHAAADGCPLCTGPDKATRVLRYDVRDVTIRFAIYGAVLLVATVAAMVGAAAARLTALALAIPPGAALVLAFAFAALLRRRRIRHAFYLAIGTDRFVLGAGGHRREVAWKDVRDIEHDDDDRRVVVVRAGGEPSLEMPAWLEGASTTDVRDALVSAWKRTDATA